MKRPLITHFLSMRSLWLLAGLSFLITHQLEAELIVRSSLKPKEAWIGQRVTWQIDVLSSEGWAQIPAIGSLTTDMPGAHLKNTDSQGTRLQENINGDSYSGQRYEPSIFPQQDGTLSTPKLPLAISVKGWGYPAKIKQHSKIMEADQLIAKRPPGVTNIQRLVTSPSFKMTQRWESVATEAPKYNSETQFLDLGQAIKRIITFEGEDLSAMAFPILNHQGSNSGGVYQATPEITDRMERGELFGKRIETITYVAESPGSLIIPDLNIDWWHPKDQKLTQVSLEGKTFEIKGTLMPADSEAESKADTPANMTLLLFWVISLLALAILLVTRVQSKARQHVSGSDSERKLFHDTLKAVKQDSPDQIVKAIFHWLDHIQLNQIARMDSFFKDYGDQEAEKAAEELMQGFLANEAYPQHSRVILLQSLKRSRHNWRLAQRTQDQIDKYLPRLN